YDQLAGLPSGRAQPHMAKVFADYQSFMVLALIAGAAGIALGIVSKWRKLRGIFAGIAFLVAAAPILYTIFTIAFAIPDAATSDVSSNIREFSGSIRGTVSEVWGQRIGWYLPMGSGLAFAWASSDLWHVRAMRKRVPTKIEVTLKPASSQGPALPPPPPPPAEAAPVAPPEPMIEEVFVIGSNGLLVKHMSRTLMTDKDRDVVGSMIAAISSFVREAFSERGGEVHEVSLGDHRLVMCKQAGLVVAVGVAAGEAEAIVKQQGWDIRPLTCDYFGRPRREHDAVLALTSRIGTGPLRRVDLPFLKEVDDLRKEGFENRRLLDSPEGYIPGRNLIFYGLAGHYAELDAVRYIVGGHNGIDPESFPDASPKFFNFLNSVFHLSLWSYDASPVQILVPLSGKSKDNVIRMGLDMKVPFDVTWSCYWDREVHCGTCVSCRERRDAFAKVGVEDPVAY